MSSADEAYRFCRLFEAELLLELMLRHWRHPLADDSDFRNALIESTTEVLKASCKGEALFEDLAPSDMNFVAAVWYSEWTTLQNASRGIGPDQRRRREKWLASLRRAVPSCFCRQDDLTG